MLPRTVCVSSIGAVAFALALASTPRQAAAAATAVGISSFSSSPVDITFDGGAEGTVITPQTADGVTVNFGGMTYDNTNGGPFFGTSDTIAADFSGAGVVNPVTYTFTGPVSQVGFLAASRAPLSILVTSVGGGTTTLPFAVDAVGDPEFVGINDPAGIVSIQISSGDATPQSNLFGIDDVRLDAVPEPSSLGLIAAAAIATARRRRRA